METFTHEQSQILRELRKIFYAADVNSADEFVAAIALVTLSDVYSRNVLIDRLTTRKEMAEGDSQTLADAYGRVIARLQKCEQLAECTEESK